MFRFAIAFVLVLSLAACTTVKYAPISQGSLDKLEGKSVTAVRYGQPDFVVLTPGKAAFAMIGAVAGILEGNAIVKEDAIEDPAVVISAALQDKLVATKHMTPVSSTEVAKKDDIASALAASPDSDFVLDVKTLSWMFGYYPANWAHYRVIYSARLRLIDAMSKTVVAESACSSVQGDDKNPPTKDQLLENNAALLKDYLGKAATACSAVLARDVLKL